jgi:hypothetical protein
LRLLELLNPSAGPLAEKDMAIFSSSELLTSLVSSEQEEVRLEPSSSLRLSGDAQYLHLEVSRESKLKLEVMEGELGKGSEEAEVLKTVSQCFSRVSNWRRLLDLEDTVGWTCSSSSSSSSWTPGSVFICLRLLFFGTAMSLSDPLHSAVAEHDFSENRKTINKGGNKKNKRICHSKRSLVEGRLECAKDQGETRAC